MTVFAGHKKLLAKNLNSLWSDINFGIPQTFIRIENILFTLHTLTSSSHLHVHTYTQAMDIIWWWCAAPIPHIVTLLFFLPLCFFILVCRNKQRMEYSMQSVASVFLSLGPVSHRQLNIGQATWVWGVCLCARVASANSPPAVSGRPVNVIDVIALECSVFTSVSLWIRWWAHGACTVSGGGLGIELAQCVHHVSTVKGTAIVNFRGPLSRNL